MNERLPSPDLAPQLPAIGKTSMPIPQMSVEDAVIERVLRDPALDVTKVKDVLELRRQLYEQRRLERLDQAREDFFNEMAKVQSSLRAVFRDKDGQRSRYATYEQLDRQVRPIYTRHGFLVTFNTKPCDVPNHIIVTAKVARGLHVEEYETPPLYSDNKGPKGAPTEMNLIQATGSAWTYGRRYLTLSIWNIALTNDATDDDGHAAGGGKVATALTEKQIENLYKLIEESNTDQDKFLKWGGVDIVEDLPPVKYPAAVAFLNRRKAENNAGAERVAAAHVAKGEAAPAKKKPLELP